MALMTKLKEIMPWKRKPVETHEVISLRDDINQLFDRLLVAPFDARWPSFGNGGPGLNWMKPTSMSSSAPKFRDLTLSS